MELTARDLQVSVDDAGSYDSNGSITNYSWDYGDGTVVSGATMTTPKVHFYSSGGAKTITLTVTDNSGLTASTSQQVTLTNTAAGDDRPNASNTGVPSAVADRLITINLEKANKSTSNLPSLLEESLVITRTGPSAYVFTKNGSSYSMPSGSYYYQADGGLVIDRVHIKGYVEIEAPDVTIRRSKVQGLWMPTGIGSARRVVRQAKSMASDLTIEDSEIFVDPSTAGSCANCDTNYHHNHAVDATRFVLRRSNLWGTVDGMQIWQGFNSGGSQWDRTGYYTNALVEKNYIHDTQYYLMDMDRNPDGPSHSDAIQVECSNPASGVNLGVQIVGNTLDITNSYKANACVQVTKNTCNTTRFYIGKNWMDGAIWPVNVGSGASGQPIDLAVNENKFGPNRANAMPNDATGWNVSYTATVMALKSNTDGSSVFQNVTGSQKYVYFSWDPPSAAGSGYPTGDSNGNIMVSHTRGQDDWGSSSQGAAVVGYW